MDRERQLPLDDALRIVAEVAEALIYAHARGVVHRDIKPENILIENGHAVLADFGIALLQLGGRLVALRQGWGDRRLSGDLDTIVLTAMRRVPAERYPSVDRLMQDVAALQSSLPISARPPTWAYGLGGRRIQPGVRGLPGSRSSTRRPCFRPAGLWQTGVLPPRLNSPAAEARP